MSAFLDAHPRYAKVLAAKRVSLRLQGRGTMDVVAEAQEWKKPPEVATICNLPEDTSHQHTRILSGGDSAPSLPNACHC